MKKEEKTYNPYEKFILTVVYSLAAFMIFLLLHAIFEPKVTTCENGIVLDRRVNEDGDYVMAVDVSGEIHVKTVGSDTFYKMDIEDSIFYCVDRGRYSHFYVDYLSTEGTSQ